MIRVRSFEFTILDWIQAHLRNPAMDLLMPALTALGNSGPIWIIIRRGCMEREWTLKAYHGSPSPYRAR